MAKQKVMRVPAQRFMQHGRPIYTIAMTGHLLAFLENKPQIRRYNPGKAGKEPHGYQRVQDTDDKVEQIAKYVGDPSNSLVDPVNLNMPIETGELVFEPISQSHPSLGYILLPSDAALNIYDGGHRTLGYMRAHELVGPIDFDLPATLTNASESAECEQFALKNVTQDKIQSDLLLDLKVMLNGSLTKVDGQKRYMPKKMTSGMSWLPEAREIARLLNESHTGAFQGNPWHKRMRYANDVGQKVPNLDHWFKLGKFAQYLVTVATNSYSLLPESIPDRAVVICNMWKAIQTLVPDAFTKNALKYRLTTGHVAIEPLHRLLSSFMLYYLHGGDLKDYETFQDATDAIAPDANKIPSPEEFVEILKKCRVRDAMSTSKGNPLFTEKHWKLEGPSRHYHGKGNVSILVGEVNKSLGIPPSKQRSDAKNAES
jgi:DGQHR domain-containing protein